MNQSTVRTAAPSSSASKAVPPLFATDYHVYINHTDAGGIVYHANHLTFFENARRDWFTQLGLNAYFLQSDDNQVQHFVVSSAELQYKQAIFLDEKINVRVDKVILKPASIVFYQSIHRYLKDDSFSQHSLLSHAKIVIACVQNQVKSDDPERSLNLDTSNATMATIPSAAPIRPIRVPQRLSDSIKAAIRQQEAAS